MKNIHWFGQLAKNKIAGWKFLLFASMQILSTVAPGPLAQAAPRALAPEEILTRMEERLEQQVNTIESYQARRRYLAANSILKNPAALVVEESYSAPGAKQFRELERSGSSLVYKRVFTPLLEVERETIRESTRPQVDLNRRNYRFTFLEHDEAAAAYVFQAEPVGPNPYLLRGQIWVNDKDFGVQRIEGEPAKRHSVFIRRTHFVHQFAKFGDFWFPVHHRSEAEMFLVGHSTLEIDYFDYQWQCR